MIKKIFAKQFIWILLTVIFSLPLVFSFLHPGYFPSHDGEWAVVRLADMTRLLRDGQIPARWSINLNFGYGYPLFNFAYPLPYYLGAILYLAKFGLIGSIKTLFFLTVPVSAIFMFLAGKQLWKNNWGAFAGAMLYIYLPYRVVDLFVRGSIGESISLALFPIIIWSLAKFQSNKSIRYLVVSSVFYAALITTHNIMAVLFTPVLLAVMGMFLIISDRSQIIRDTACYLGFIFLSYALSAFFWIPAILEKQFILLSKIPIADRSLYFLKAADLFIPKWGFGTPTDPAGFGYFLGFAQIIVLGLFVLFFLFKPNKKLITFVILLGIFIFMLYPVSQPVWNSLPLFKEINYPWTILAPLSFTLSLLTGYLLQNKILKMAAVLLILVAVVTVLPHAAPQKYLTTDDNFYLTNDATTTSSSELMPLWVKSYPSFRQKNMIELYSGSGLTRTISANASQMSFTGTFATDSVVRINQIYYPGWQVTIDGNPVAPNFENPKGVMDVFVRSGSHDIKLKWTETFLRITADFLSAMAAVTTLLLFLLNPNLKPLAAIEKRNVPDQQKGKRK